MSFPQILSSNLLRDLSDEQQELVAGGLTRQFEYTYTSEKYSENHGSPENTGNTPFSDPNFFMTPLWWESGILDRIAPAYSN